MIKAKSFIIIAQFLSSKEYILISQYQYYVMQFNKTNQGKWILSEYRNDNLALSLQTVEFDISFEEIYENVNLG